MKKIAFPVVFALTSLFTFSAEASVFGTPVAVSKPTTKRIDADLIDVVTDRWLRTPTPGFMLAPTSCTDVACVKKEGAAELMLTTSISKLGASLYITQTLVDVKTGEVERTVERDCAADEVALARAMSAATATLFRLDAPRAEAPRPVVVTELAERKLTRVENPNKKTALYIAGGSAMLASTGMIMALSDPYGESALPGAAVGLGLLGFMAAGIGYIVIPEYEIKNVLVPSVSTDGKGATLSVSGQF